jgi:DNA-binding MarR family transcriptional regulator
VTASSPTTDATPNVPPDGISPVPLANRLRVAMVHLGRQLRHQDPPGMSVTQHLALATVAKHGQMAIGDLAEAERLPSSAATRLIDRLEETGLVTRSRDPHDRRGVQVEITDAGRRLVDERHRLGNAWLAGRIALLTEAERTNLALSLDVVERLVLAEGSARTGAGAALAGVAAAEVPAR